MGLVNSAWDPLKKLKRASKKKKNKRQTQDLDAIQVRTMYILHLYDQTCPHKHAAITCFHEIKDPKTKQQKIILEMHGKLNLIHMLMTEQTCK